MQSSIGVLLTAYFLYYASKSKIYKKGIMFIEKNVPKFNDSFMIVLSTSDKFINKVIDVAITAICLFCPSSSLI